MSTRAWDFHVKQLKKLAKALRRNDLTSADIEKLADAVDKMVDQAEDIRDCGFTCQWGITLGLRSDFPKSRKSDIIDIADRTATA